MRRPVRLVAALALATACGQARDAAPERGTARSTYEFPPPPDAPDLPIRAELEADLDRLAPALGRGTVHRDALERIAASGDPRLAWLLEDLLRFVVAAPDEEAIVDAFERLTGVDPSVDPAFGESPWRSITNHLIAWDLPAPPGYRERKAALFLLVESKWEPFFADADAVIDWRLVSWGGVLIDDRPLGDPDPCLAGCIPALDDPTLTGAEDGDWYPDDETVFGLVVGGEAVAFPKNIMEVHEMVNVSIGGRRLGIPYCTLCGSAQAYLTDAVPEGVDAPVLRTSGLLSRSNKVMYDLRTSSLLDTFTGEALSGPLHDAGVVLDQTTVVASAWGAWKAAHPNTRIVARDGGIGREYPADPLRGRDDDGPIFPVGPVDPRLPVQAQVLGVIAPSGDAIAFPVDQARAAIARGGKVTVDDVEVLADGGGLRARRRGGGELPAHQAFWFAWSQFNPGTAVWVPVGG